MAAKKQSVYSKIAENIISKIKSGEYPVGGMLPPERVLMDIYKVERTTVRRGLELLSRDGYIKKVAGLGSVILSESAKPAQDSNSGNEPQEVYSKQAFAENNSVSILALFPKGEKNSSISEAITEQLKDICRKHGAKLAILSSSDSAQVLDAVKKNHAESCAVFFGTDESIIDVLDNEGINTCFVFCRRKGGRCILPDIHLSCDSAAEYLSSLGHSSVAFIGGDEDSYLERELRLSFSDEFSIRNPESDIKQYTNTGGSDEKSGFERLSELIRRAGGKFTAVAAVNDEVAIGAIKAAKYYRFSVPEDLSIVSLCSTDKGCEADCIYTNPTHIAMEIYNRCASFSEESFGVTSTFEAELFSGKTSGKAKNTQSSGRRLSDFLL